MENEKVTSGTVAEPGPALDAISPAFGAGM